MMNINKYDMVMFNTQAVAVNSANQAANSMCQMAHRSRRLREEVEKQQPKTGKNKEKQYKTRITKKELIVLFILLTALVGAVWLLVFYCLNLFA